MTEFRPVLAHNDWVLVAVADGVGLIRLNRPAAMNALDLRMATALAVAMREMENDERVRVVVLTGGPVFMAGGDLKAFAGALDQPPEDIRSDFESMIGLAHATIQAIRRMRKPVIAAVAGAAAGYGLSLASSCDLVLADEQAQFTLAYCLIGTSPDGGSTYFLPRAMGEKRAMLLALTGERFSAADAERWGLVSRVVPAGTVEAAAMELAGRLAGGPGLALARTKELIRQSLGNSLETQLMAEQVRFAACTTSKDFAEGVRAFVEKRMPNFTGE